MPEGVAAAHTARESAGLDYSRHDEERMERLKKIWLDLKRKNAIGGIEARTIDEQDDIS
jgi:hypothetical protein